MTPRCPRAPKIEAWERFVEANPASVAAHVEATGVMPGGNTRTARFHSPFPLTMARGEGCHLWDADGHDYIDMLGEYTAGLYVSGLQRLKKVGVSVTTHRLHVSGRKIGEALIEEAHSMNADLLVMGAYTHDRFIEFILGGATREIFAAADLPALMHHFSNQSTIRSQRLTTSRTIYATCSCCSGRQDRP